MSKKAIMLGIYAINLIVFVICSMLWFCMYPIDTVEKNKTTVTVKWKTALDHDAYIDTLYEIADEISSDLMLRNLTDDYQFQYYRTENDPDFIALEGLDPSQQYATDPQNGEQKIRGFFFLTDSDFTIAPLRLLKGTETDLSIQEFQIPNNKVNDFSKAVTVRGLEINTEQGASTGSDFSFLYRAMAALAFFLIVSIVFYAFSRSKDMIVKKTMGFSDRNIVTAEIKENALLLLLITAGILLSAFVVFSVLAGISSTLYYLKKSIAQVLLYLLGAFLLFVIFILFVSTQCSISSSKGKSFNKQLFVFTVVFKTVTVIFLGIAMTELFRDCSRIFTMYHATKKTADLVAGYAETELNARLENPAHNPEKYAPIFLSFYHEMHDDHNFIIADFNHLIYDLEAGSATAKNYNAVINDNYLDTFDTVYGTDGKPIHSDALMKGKFNFLIPEHYDPSNILNKYISADNYSEDDFHFIRFADSSKFFTFSNSIQNGYVGGSRIVAEVFDPDLFYSYESTRTACGSLESFYSTSGFYTYDSASDQDPYYQILPIIRKTGMDKIFISSPSVKQQFMNDLKFYRNSMIVTLVQLLVILFAFIVIVVYAAELDYKIYAKDYSIKCVTGYSFLDIFIMRIIFKLIVLPVLVIMPSVSLPVALCCVLSELVIYVICMKKRIGKNTVTILKGE